MDIDEMSEESGKEVREIIVDIMKNEGVEYAFGHTGAQIRFLWDSIDRDEQVNVVFNKQEGNAVYMAMGHYQQSGKVGVVLGTTGPGVQNMVAGIASAHLDSIPMVIIGSMVPSYSAGKNALQDSSGRGRAVDQLQIFQACTKSAMLAMTPGEIPTIFREAFRVAKSGRPGPVYVDVPGDYWQHKVDYQSLAAETYKCISPLAADLVQTEHIMSRLYAAQKPVIVIGEGAFEGGNIRQQIRDFIDQTGIPFAVSPLAKDYVDEIDLLCLGALRVTGGNRYLYQCLKAADFVLSLGNRFEQWEWDWMSDKKTVLPNAVIAHIDPDEDEIGRVFSAEYSMRTSASGFFTAAQSFLTLNSRHPKHDEFARECDAALSFVRKVYEDNGGLHPKNLIKVAQDVLPDDACILCDTGNIGSLVITQLKTSLTQRFFHAQRNSPMGYSLPASMGAALEHQGPVVSFIGDGSFNMTSNELALLLNIQSKIIIIIANDGSSGAIRDGNLRDFNSTTVSEHENPAYAEMAKSYNMKGFTVNNEHEFSEALLQSLEGTQSVIIDAVFGDMSGMWEEQ